MERINQFEPYLGEEEKKELMDVIDSGWFTEAKKTRELEKQFAEFVGRKYAVVTTSGTTALFLALKALGLEQNDEVIVPDLTFVASPNSVDLAGGKVSLVDINKKDLGLDLKKTEQLITSKTKGVMPVDFNGRAPDLIALQEIAKKNNMFVVEDACHTIGSFYQGKHMGYFSDIGIFSLSTPKIITAGQGGVLVTDNSELYEKIRMIKDFGRDVDKKHNMKNAFDHVTMGYNFKFTEFQAAVGVAQMRKLPQRIEHKKRMYTIFKEELKGINQIEFLETDLNDVIPWFNDILLPNQKIRDDLIDHLQEAGIGSRMFYPPIHELTPYSNLKGDFTNTIEMSQRGVWLPSSAFLTDDDIIRVCSEIKKFAHALN
ncbi:aminotransferase [Nitrosopumilus cobalaminigenes]|uniref:Aminotransferase n=1 Tax=Nitrosopumilus cobalaminigenes TaxID=1470066 RepID=A0A7D5QYB5_9ARCH|nr:DegT/DnrJ/EryC1/StrS family aminotransferase [Nitrosopumilus cobalaminigenes]QLH02220.1 aminotransferase [Nitrosopumilus cobalaminigenes]